MAEYKENRNSNALQFHPEVLIPDEGLRVLQTLSSRYAGCKPTWRWASASNVDGEWSVPSRNKKVISL